MEIRHAEPTDHARAAAVIDDWWGGRQMQDMLPRLFFTHFRDTSFVAEEDGELAGFLCGFLSQTYPDQAYVHFFHTFESPAMFQPYLRDYYPGFGALNLEADHWTLLWLDK